MLSLSAIIANYSVSFVYSNDNDNSNSSSSSNTTTTTTTNNNVRSDSRYCQQLLMSDKVDFYDSYLC